MNALNISSDERVNRTAVRAQTQFHCAPTVRSSAGRWCRTKLIFAALAVALLALGGAQAQTIRRITAPGKFYVDDKQSAGIVYNYAVYAISNSTSTNIVSAYVVMTNMIATNLITLASTETGVRSLGALAPGQTKLAAFYLKGPSFTGNSDTLINVTNETHTIRVYNGLPGFGATLVSSNYSFTNIIFVIEALANKITIITNLNPLAVLGSDVDLVIGGETGTLGGGNSVSFSPGVLGSWRPDAYELVGSRVHLADNGDFTNQMYFDPTVSGFTNYTGQTYTNTFRFRAVKVTGTNLPVSPFSFVDSGAGTKHTAVSSLITGGGSNVIYSAANVITITSQSVTPTSLLAPGGTVTYSVTFSNQSTTTLDLNEIRDALPGFPGNFTYIPGTATFNSSPLVDPSIAGQLLRWALPLTVPASSAVTLTFQATAPLPAGQYTNSIIGILGNEQIDTTIITTDDSPSLSVFTIIPVSDVAVTKSAPASVYSGAPFNYTITVTNLGPSPATSLSITDSLPANVTFVSASPGAFTNGSQVIWTNFGPVAAGTATNLTITVTPPVVAASLTNTARGFSPVLDPNSTNNTSPPVFTSVTPAADLRITKSASTASVLPGANVTYNITVTNFGASLATSVVVTDTLPASVSFVSASSGGVFSSGKVIWSSLGNFAAGTGTSLSLTVTAPLNGSISNTATASSTTFDTNTLNNVTPPIVTLVSNLPPGLVNDTASVPRNTAVTVPVLANDSDANGNPLTLLGVTQTNGTAVLSNGTNVLYTPSTNFMGTTVLTYTVTDGQGATNSALITISVTNRPPVAVNDSTLGTNSVPQVIKPLVNDSDADGDSLTITNVVATGGIVTINPGATNLTYTPTNSFSSTITYTIADGFGGTATATILVIGNNVAPVANNQSVTLPEDTSTNLVVSGTDIDSATLFYALLTNPAHGTLSTLNTNTGAVTYSPSNNFNGADSFTFTVFDGALYATGTVSITVSPVNDPPALVDDNANVSEDSTNSIPVLVNDTDGDGDPLTIVSVTTTNGTATIVGTNVVYTPSTNFFGTNVMSYCVTDGTVTNCAFITVVVNPVNDAPVADNQAVTIPEDGSTNLVLTASDVDNTNLTFSILTGPASGGLSPLNTNSGAVTYTPNANYAGSDGFTFRVFDGSLYATGTVSITVTPQNDEPVADSQSVTNLEDTALPITLTGSDVDGPVTNFVLGILPLHGTLSGSGANLTYTPTNNYFGPDSFTFTVNDGSLTSAVATVSLTVLATNIAPVIVNDSVTMNEDGTNTIPVLVNDSDADGDPLTIVSVVSTNGTAVIVGTNVVYTPSANFSGTNVMTYCVTDGAITNCALITVIVNAVNDAPLAFSQSVTNLEDTALPITLTGADVDGPVTNFVLGTLPLHGSLSGSGANLTYTPTNNYNGPDSFTFTVNDGSLTSAVATVSITVLPVNDAPVAVNDSYNVFKNLTLNIGAPGVLTNDTDVEGSALTAALVANVTHGTLNLGTNGGFTYTPSNNYVGPDSFTYRASDGVSNSATATVSITVLATNTAPVAVNDGYNVNEDTLLNVLVTGGVLTNDTDVDADTLTATIAVTTTNGILSLNANGSFQYTPNTNFVGVDTFTYRANDALTNSGIATVTITINAVNDAPAATNLSVTMPEDSSTNLVVRGSDVESTNLSYAILASPAHGTLGTMNTNTGAVTYSPSNNFNGADSFTFTVFDGSLYATGTVSITVTPINDPPVAVNDTTVTSEDVAAIMSAASLLANDLDADTDTLTVTSVQSAINGTVSLSGSTVTFTPSLNYNGPASFTYTVSDGNGGTSTATVNITVQPVNDAPVAANDSYSTFKNVPLNVSAPGVLANDTDVDSSLTAVLATNVTHGVLVLNTNGGFTYTPSNNYVGPDSFTYRASDGSATSLAVVTLTIAATNTAPVAVNDSYSVNEDNLLNVLVTGGVLTNDTDVDGDTLTATVVATTTNGVLSLNANGSFTYTPNTNFNGVDHFTYLAHDAFTNSAVATVTITVNAVNDAPVATNLSVTIPEDSSTNLVVRGSDVESTNLSYAILNNPVHGTLGTLNTNTGAVTYSPSNNFNGADSFTFTVFDGSLYATGTVSITVLPINDPPVAVNDNATVNEDSTNNIPVLVNDTDPDGNPLTIVNVSSTNGTATIVGTNVVYTPSANFNGTNVITYCISDGFVTNCATITVVVLPVNDAPAANNQSVTINEDASTNLVLTASDVDSSFTFSIVSGPTSGSLGTLNTNTGAVTYSPNANYNGGDSFTFRVFDGSLYATGTVSITVLPVNDAPVATNDNYSTPANTALVVAASGVLANDSDVEGNALTAALVANPLHGTLSLSLNGGFTYTPTNDYSGPDSFTYRASDGISNSATATVTITVAALADVAVSKTGPTNVNPGASFSYVITVTNYGPTTASNIVVVDSLPTNLVFSSATGGGSNVSYIVTWPTLPALAKNAGTNFTIFVIAPTNGSFVNVASATATTADPDASNNNGSAGGSRVSSTVVAVQFGVRQGTNVFNPQTGLYEQLVSVTNLSGSTVAAFQVLVGDIRGTNGVSRTNVWLWNATGTNFDGRRYVQYNSPLDPGSNATVRLEFYNPLRTPFTNSIEILATFPTPAVTNLSGGVVVDTYFWDYRAAGDSRFVIEWTSIIGRNYTVIYGPTPTGPWTAATPSVTATATRVQWYDDGPPKTASKPQANVSRYYRVILNP